MKLYVCVSACRYTCKYACTYAIFLSLLLLRVARIYVCVKRTRMFSKQLISTTNSSNNMNNE